jgi:hypothetical protein
MINIVVVGTSTKNGMKLLKEVQRAIQKIERKIIVKGISDTSSNNYGIKNVPALIVDGKVISQGKVLSEREIHRVLVASE